MTTSQIIACTISTTAALIAIAALASIRRTARELLAARRTFTVPGGGGEVTATAPMSDADYEEFKARWLAAYKPGCAHPVQPINEEQPDA